MSAATKRIWHWLAILSVLAATVISAKIALSATHPSFPYDEIDQLQMSRMLAGFVPSDVRGAGYYPAWAFLLAPLWWFTSDPFTVYRCAIVLGLLLGLLAIWPLSQLARRFRLTGAQSVVAGAVVVTLPAISLQADYALSERMLFLVMALVVLTAWRLWEKPGVARAVLFSLMIGLMHFTHVRMTAVVLAAAIWLALMLVHHWRSAVTGLIVLAACFFVVRHLGPELNVRLIGDFAQGENLWKTISQLRPGTLARVIFGQAWTQVVGTLGLVAIGFAGMIYLGWRELRRLRVGRALFLLAICAAMYVLTVLNWSSDYHLFLRDWRRLDTWLYGRYIDPVFTLLALVGVCLLIRGVRLLVLFWAAALSAIILLVTTFWVSLDAPTWAYITPAHIPGVMPWAGLLPDSPFPPGTRIVPTLWNENRFWLWASLCVIASFIGYFLLRRLRLILSVALFTAVAVMAVTADGASDDFHRANGKPPASIHELRAVLEDTGPVDVQLNSGCSGNGAADALMVNYIGYWLLPGAMSTFDARESAANAPLIVNCGLQAPPHAPGAHMLPGDLNGYHLWVRPGPLQEALSERGVLAG